MYEGQIPLRSLPGFAGLTPVQRRGICNGAGAKGSILSKFIPNTMWGLDCIEAFDRHDYDYWAGDTEEHKFQADLNLLVNLAIIIIHGSPLLSLPRLCRAAKYYLAVHYRGHDAYWKNKPYFKRAR